AVAPVPFCGFPGGAAERELLPRQRRAGFGRRDEHLRAAARTPLEADRSRGVAACTKRVARWFTPGAEQRSVGADFDGPGSFIGAPLEDLQIAVVVQMQPSVGGVGRGPVEAVGRTDPRARVG